MSRGTANAKPRRLARRSLLQLGLGSLGLASLPLLTRSGQAGSVAVPQRLLLVYSPNGTIQEEFWPLAGASETDFTLGKISQPFEPFKRKLLFLKGLTLKIAEVGPGGPHQKGTGGLFTNSELQEGTFQDGCGAAAGFSNGISVDQEAAKVVGVNSVLPSLELGVRAIENEVRGRLIYAGPGNPLPPMNSPRAAFDRLFSSFVAGNEDQQVQRQAVIDAVSAQYGVVRPQVSRVDQLKLDQNLELIRGIERRMTVAGGASCVRPVKPDELEPNSEDTMPEITSKHVDLLTAAFACDLTRVASLQFSTAINDIRFPWLNSLGGGHQLSHDSSVDATTQLVARHRWMAGQIASLMQKLDAIPEGDGTVLDHTLIVWGNELGVGNVHSHTDLPFLLAGGGGGLKMGRFLKYDGVSHGCLLTSLLRVMGLPRESFGNPKSPSSPLPGLV